jgi:hypothetical protein
MSQIKLFLVTVAVCLVVESASAAVYKITDYGATADGTTDCSPAIGAAIAASTHPGTTLTAWQSGTHSMTHTDSCRPTPCEPSHQTLFNATGNVMGLTARSKDS